MNIKNIQKTFLTVLCLGLATPTWANNFAEQTKNFVQDRFDASGEVRARMDSVKVEDVRDNSRHLNANVWLSGRVYRDWKVVTQLESQLNLKTGKMNGDRDVEMNKLFIEGTVYDKVKLRAGKFGSFSAYGRVLDNEITGVEATANYGLPVTVGVGRVTKQFNDNAWGVGVHRNLIAYATTSYPVTQNVNVGATVAYVKNAAIVNKDAWFTEVGADVKFAPDWTAMAAFSASNLNNVRNDAGKKVSHYGGFAGVKFKNADWNVQNSYDVFANVRHVGALSGVSSVEDYSKNVQGVQVGANFVPFKNVKLNTFYLAGKEVTPTFGTKKQDIHVFRAQIEYKF